MGSPRLLLATLGRRKDLGEHSKIEWTDSTWNPVTGCTKVSAGCDNCYAHTLAHGRLARVYTRRLPVVDTPENQGDPFAVRMWEERLREPAKWKDPRMIFVNSMSDLFHVDIPDAFVRKIFEVMLEVDRHIYQVLTKRPARAVRFFKMNSDLFPAGEIPRHIWTGTSVENQEVDYRIAHLRGLPAAVRFLSCEPLIGELNLNGKLPGIHWVIAGGESGIGYRRMDPAWPAAIQSACETQGVAFFFKQWGGRTPKAGGRTLLDQTWDEMPAVGEPPVALAGY
jgi:protein gp37